MRAAFPSDPAAATAPRAAPPPTLPGVPAFVLLGDLEGEPAVLAALDARLPVGVPVLQVGDLGWRTALVPSWRRVAQALRRPVYWIRGNKDEYGPQLLRWMAAEAPVEVAPNLLFVPDGCVLTLGDIRVACLGGAASANQRQRDQAGDWSPHEGITPAQQARAAAWGPFDLMVTHVPPQSVIQASSDPGVLHALGAPAGWQDPNADVVEALWRAHGHPPLVCGHMHYRYRSPEGVIVLDEQEALPWPLAGPAAT